MNLSYESSYYNILQLSQNEEEGKKIEYLNRFISNLSQTYGIPALQLEQIYFNHNQHSSNRPTRQTIQHEVGKQLDFGDKIHINHSILKKIVEMIDKKTEYRTQNGLYNKHKGKLYSADRFSKQQLQNPEKIIQVRRKLLEVIKYIDNQELHKHTKNEVKSSEALYKIHEEPSFHQLSLQYSKEASDYNNNFSFKMSNDSNQHFDDSAKETTSQIIEPNHGVHLQKKQRSFYQQSLQRISEALSGQSLSKEQSPLRNNSYGTSVNRSFHNTALNGSLIEHYDDIDHEDTRKMILNAINNKIKMNSKENIKIQEQNIYKEGRNGKNIKKHEFKPLSKMAGAKKGLWQSGSKNTLVSFQSLDDLSKKDRSMVKKNPFHQEHPMSQSIQSTQRLQINAQNNKNSRPSKNRFHTQTTPLRQAQKVNPIMDSNNFQNRKPRLDARQYIKQPNISRQYPSFQQMVPATFNPHQQNIRNSSLTPSSVQSIPQKQQFPQMRVQHHFQPQIYLPVRAQSQSHHHQIVRVPSMTDVSQNFRPVQYHSLPKQHHNLIPQSYQIIKHGPQVNTQPPPSFERTFYSQPIQRKQVFTAPLTTTHDFRPIFINNPQIKAHPQYRNKVINTIPKVSVLQRPLVYANQFANPNPSPQNYPHQATNSIPQYNHQLSNQSAGYQYPNNRNISVVYSPLVKQAMPQQLSREVSAPRQSIQTKHHYRQPSIEANVPKQPIEVNLPKHRESTEAKRLDFSIVNKFQPRANSSRLQNIAQLTENSQTPHYGASSYVNQNDSNFQIEANSSKKQLNSISSTKRLKKKGINLTEHNSSSQRLFRHQ